MRFMPSLSYALTSLLFAGSAHAQMLTGWAQMPAATFADGPTSGQFLAPNPFGPTLPPAPPPPPRPAPPAGAGLFGRACGPAQERLSLPGGQRLRHAEQLGR